MAVVMDEPKFTRKGPVVARVCWRLRQSTAEVTSKGHVKAWDRAQFECGLTWTIDACLWWVWYEPDVLPAGQREMRMPKRLVRFGRENQRHPPLVERVRLAPHTPTGGPVGLPRAILDDVSRDAPLLGNHRETQVGAKTRAHSLWWRPHDLGQKQSPKPTMHRKELQDWPVGPVSVEERIVATAREHILGVASFGQKLAEAEPKTDARAASATVPSRPFAVG